MTTLSDITDFLRKRTRTSLPIQPDTDLEEDLGVYGDDMCNLLAEYAERFGVDMSEWLWYFHTGEEGMNLGGLFFEPPNARVERIPITPAMLLEYAQSGKWSVPYPDHSIPEERLDLMINQALALGVLTSIGGVGLWKWLRWLIK